MNKFFPGHREGEGTRLNHNIDPRKKDKNWILEMTKAIYRDFNRYSPESFYNGRDRDDGLINYVQGLQSDRQYRQREDINKSATKNLTSVNHSKRPLNLVSKYFRI